MTVPYIINVALILAACLVFYKLLLRRETFYRVNRYMLVGCLVVAFALPMLQVPQQFSLRKTDTTADHQPRVIENSKTAAVSPPPAADGKKKTDTLAGSPSLQTQASENTAAGAGKTSFTAGNLMNWLFWIYWFGAAVFAASFLFQVILLLWRAYRNPVITDGPYRIVEVSGDKAPCSFGNNIFINPEKYEWETYNQIIEHEKVHIRQRHTLDIILAELVLVFQWFNPFAWVYRREIENNLEFLTDDQLLEQKIDKQSYQLSLVKVSAPHFPLSLTTNYNQSILKKRIAMMNSKRSNLHTAWKYFFLVPLLAFLVCLLNEPVVHAQDDRQAEKKSKTSKHGMENEGYWFAVIKNDRVNIRFSSEKPEDEDFNNHSDNSTTFKLAELGNIPKGSSGTFYITREAGKMEMTGKFEGNTGMGTYQFVADKAFVEYMNRELGEKLDEENQLAFFFIDIKKDYLQMLKKEGFTGITKEDLIPMAAMKIDAAYIKSIKDAGFKDVAMEKLIPLKALHVDAAYIKEIRDAGYKEITTDQLVTFKAQGIDKAYIEKVKMLKDKDGQPLGDDNPEEIVSLKAMHIDEAYINSFKSVGLNIPHEELVSFKAVGVTPEYIKSWHALGFKDIKPEEFVGMKSQNVTPEFMKSFTDLGYKQLKPEDLVSFKALGISPDYIRSFVSAGYKITDPDQLPALKSLGVTPEYIKGFEAMGYKDIDLDDMPGLKSQNVTPEFIKGFEAVGFKNIPLDDIISLKAVGVTPEYIKEMKAKGFNYNKVQKYITLKSID